ncbi:chorismate synthase [Pyrobaculum islandicum DSM 4184]|uniref:Chorismate synthase n=1 Tax=Pyrobaculum islandicum (strain DSM 4184 / JCM 9189 / GEO3) TaxID=384616 RepID=AROC_PYRIL|nr:chorismate synthase [Pyrobaculum islandicum]A1RVD1.1 RecName: Full=Chorismate synthase; Short=CS; AltName: Full=5-enolpyruvylshikimate-3-phosphate phospholyase [Pyrobaculum islandicum DSM 4184]ABL88913.1 chorismate synthase [Pyrobaculum islandicum DSM 4184]
MNTFGREFRITTFGESHGKAIGVVIDGVPAGLELTEEDIKRELERRMFCHIPVLNPRCEPEEVEILSGVKEGYTQGTPIAVVIWNRRVISSYYEELWMKPRPGHADFAYYLKYGRYYDHRGGGRASGRTTAAVVAAGAVAKKILALAGAEVAGHIVELGGVEINASYTYEDVKKSWERPLPVVDQQALDKMLEKIQEAAARGDSIGGGVEVWAVGVPPGLGEPHFGKIKADIAAAAFSIPGAIALDWGMGRALAKMWGSEANDPITVANGRPTLATNKIGGVLGGITVGTPIYFRVWFKPTPSVRKPQQTVDLAKMEPTTIEFKGRYDVSIVPKALVALEAITAVTLADHLLRAGLIRRDKPLEK